MCVGILPGPSGKAIAAAITRRRIADKTCIFRVVTLLEPLKKDMVHFLELEHGSPDIARQAPPRTAMVQILAEGELRELHVDLDQQAVVSDTELPGRHAHIDPEFMKQVELSCLADPEVQRLVKELNLPEEATVVVEPWTYGTDGMNDMSEGLTMCWFYMRMSSDPDANYYAYPLDLCAEVYSDLQVKMIYRLPSTDADRAEFCEHGQEYDRHKIHEGSEYHPNLTSAPRTTTKPYYISQPEGPSFSIQGNQITWEKWTMRVGFNYREGMTLHDIRYDNRSLFYRLSLAEMFVPYGDPRTPYPRKAAFDLGNDGAGICANNLKLGCDCLGHIKYFSSVLVTPSGLPLHTPNVICCHEIDDGILWKHTNPRTANAVVARSRVLVLQTIITASNYEYIFSFSFSQDASIHYEIRATGILSTAPIRLHTTSSYGTTVAPGVLAPNHQHLFCLRIDPSIDGQRNTLVVEESHALPPLPHINPHRVGYTTLSTPISHESGHDLDHSTNRTFKILNESVINPTTGTPVGYKLVPFYSQLLLAQPTSYHARRSEFGKHAVWVTRYRDGELYPAGRFTMQSKGGEGIASWIAKREEGGRGVRGEDIVVWHTFGSTHNPRAEDWPVMPCEKMVVGLKPVNFFERNPGVDVAVARAGETAGSVLYQ
ncbi:copper amine oxidase [Podospora aff. communis PSN243]|uniref:Amine oxidase n=1 Tax=Podospora aff. communis PSN243 TaxID=3040156 RepID=A0AAV9G0S6_9PEZI|nr:copper amine oxidase [Podospora aff. communis PSN243]